MPKKRIEERLKKISAGRKLNMGRFTDFTKKGYHKVKGIIQDEIKNRKERREEMESLSDNELKRLAITKGQPYEDEWVRREETKKRIEERLKKI